MVGVVGECGVMSFPLFQEDGFGSLPEGDKWGSHECGGWDIGTSWERGVDY